VGDAEGRPIDEDGPSRRQVRELKRVGFEPGDGRKNRANDHPPKQEAPSSQWICELVSTPTSEGIEAMHRRVDVGQRLSPDVDPCHHDLGENRLCSRR
jgi:hypothetical protein